MLVELPYKFILRNYQLPAWQAFFTEKKKRLVTVWHRRAGKDAMALNMTIAASQMRVGAYYYMQPELNQARRNIWKAIGKDGKRFLDHFPAALIKSVNNTEMSIEFNNGSIFRLCGSDRYDSYMGSNPVGVVLSEYSISNPAAWDFMRPILAENEGWAMFNYTPRGGNHGYELAEMAKQNPNWFFSLLTVADTRRDDGNPVITPEAIEEDRLSGMSEDMIQQEYFCSFKAAVQGAYFSTQLRQAENQGRICDFSIDNHLAVNTYWDLGVNDKCAIWFIQHIRNEARAVYYYENSGEGVEHYIHVLNQFRDKYGIVYNKHYWPHDGGVREFGNKARKRNESARDLGLNVIIVPRVQDKQDSIEAARSIFSKVWFHKSNCKQGLACLTEYHKEYNEDSKTFSNHPKHNWASNGADAFQTFGMSWKGYLEDQGSQRIQSLDWSI
jgi:phage terminase large subunit